MELFQRCIEQGWDIFPVRDKRPVIKWKLGACRTWESWPEGCDIGIATGARSGIVVVDDDRGKHGYSDWCSPVSTPRVETRSGGWHYYYRHPGGSIANSAGKLEEFVDVRGDGGYVVCYGIPEGELALYPGELGGVRRRKIQPIRIQPALRDLFMSKILQGNVLGGVGGRNNQLFRLACIFLENDMPIDVLFQTALNAGLEPEEIERVLESAKDTVLKLEDGDDTST